MENKAVDPLQVGTESIILLNPMVIDERSKDLDGKLKGMSREEMIKAQSDIAIKVNENTCGV